MIEGEKKMLIIWAIYLCLCYWAVGCTLWANKIVFGTASNIFIKRVCLGAVLGWILIPIAIIKLFIPH